MVASKSELVVPKGLRVMGPWHGYGIAECVEQISEQALEINQGTISASLVCLQQRGWISSGVRRQTTAGRSSTASQKQDASSFRQRRRTRSGSLG